ncbi:MAG: hypothetical protein QM791_17370 [Ferruginibacter sp.]
MAKKISPKKFIVACVILIIMMAGLSVYLIRKESAEKKLLLEKGVRAEASVLNLTEKYNKKSGGKISNRRFYMDVAFFSDTTKENITVKDTASTAAKNGPELVDKIFSKINAGNKPLGDYQKLTISISGFSFKKYNVDDKVKIVYLKDDPSVVKLLEEIE